MRTANAGTTNPLVQTKQPAGAASFQSVFADASDEQGTSAATPQSSANSPAQPVSGGGRKGDNSSSPQTPQEEIAPGTETKVEQAIPLGTDRSTSTAKTVSPATVIPGEKSAHQPKSSVTEAPLPATTDTAASLLVAVAAPTPPPVPVQLLSASTPQNVAAPEPVNPPSGGNTQGEFAAASRKSAESITTVAARFSSLANSALSNPEPAGQDTDVSTPNSTASGQEDTVAGSSTVPPSRTPSPQNPTPAPDPQPSTATQSRTGVFFLMPQPGGSTAQQSTPAATRPDSAASLVSGIPASQLFLNDVALSPNVGQFISNGESGMTISQSSPAKSVAATSGASGKSTTADNNIVSSSADKSAHAAPAGNQNSSSTQAGNPSTPQVSGSQAQHGSNDSQAAPKAPDASAIQSVLTHAPAPEATANRETTAHAETHASQLPTPDPLPSSDGGEMMRTSGINAARLIQTLSETGMHVGMRSVEFGDISIRTLVSQEQMVAQISVDHGDLGRTIAAQVPGVQAKLGDEFGLRASIQVNQSGASFSGEQQGSAQQDPRSFSRTAAVGIGAPRESEPVTPHVFTGSVQDDRLDIRA